MDIPTAGAAMFLVSGTPAPVAARVAELTVRTNTILLAPQPRVAREDLHRALDMVREISQQFPGWIALHPAYAQQLAQRNLLPPDVPVAAPTPSTPFPAPPASSPPTRVPPPGAPSGGVEIRAFFARPTTLTSGQHGQLRWQIRNANEASIELEIGPLRPGELEAGCREIGPARTTTYELSGRSPDGGMAQERLTVWLPRRRSSDEVGASGCAGSAGTVAER